jgi:hypothetical protein
MLAIEDCTSFLWSLDLQPFSAPARHAGIESFLSQELAILAAEVEPGIGCKRSITGK